MDYNRIKNLTNREVDRTPQKAFMYLSEKCGELAKNLVEGKYEAAEIEAIDTAMTAMAVYYALGGKTMYIDTIAYGQMDKWEENLNKANLCGYWLCNLGVLGPGLFDNNENMLYIYDGEIFQLNWDTQIDNIVDMSLFPANTQIEAYRRAIAQGSMIKVRNPATAMAILKHGFEYIVAKNGKLFGGMIREDEFYVKRVVGTNVGWAVYKGGAIEEFDNFHYLLHPVVVSDNTIKELFSDATV